MTTYEQAATEGVSVFVSAGDEGAASCDADADYATIDTSTVTAGESRSVTGVRANFLRAKVSSITGGSGVTVQVLG